MPLTIYTTLPPLHAAAAAGDAAAIGALLDAGADIEGRCDTAPGYGAFFAGLTPLMVAAGSENSNAEAVELLLRRGAEGRATSGGGVTALWYAAGSGDAARLALLLAAGGDADETAGNGRSALREAAEAGAEESLRLLLRAGASPHPVDGLEGYAGAAPYQIPLFEAARSGSAAGVRMLLDMGAPADVRGGSDDTALMHAGSAEVVAVLLAAGCPRDARNYYGWSALDNALDSGHGPVVRALVAAGVGLEERDQYGNTALLRYCGSYAVDAAMIELLLELGADPHARKPGGETTLHVAAQLWHGARHGKLGAAVRALVAAGVAVDARDDGGNSPLHGAVGDEGGELTAIDSLLDLGADIDARNGYGSTPLMVAAYGGYRDRILVAHLLARGADPTLADDTGRTARTVAAEAVKNWENIVANPPDLGELDNTPAKWLVRRARHRLKLRGVQAMLALLDPEAVPYAPSAPDLPPLVSLGYRAYVMPAKPPFWGWSPETDHITEIGSLGCMSGFSCIGVEGALPTGFLSTPKAAWESDSIWRSFPNTQPPISPTTLYAYRAFPLSFGVEGEPQPISPDELTGGEAVPAIDLSGYTFLGYDVREHRAGQFGGCSPLSCNGLASEWSIAVNRFCLLYDLEAAYDCALVCGVEQPEPGPYVIIEVWGERRGARGER